MKNIPHTQRFINGHRQNIVDHHGVFYDLFTEDVASALGISYNQARKILADHHVPFHTVGRNKRKRFDHAAVQALIKHLQAEKS